MLQEVQLGRGFCDKTIPALDFIENTLGQLVPVSATGKILSSLYIDKPCKTAVLWDILGCARESTFLQLFQT